ncbi:hypothetical protein FHP29_19730 [Nocardioides albidus]|uniref:Ig-like domain repeat protein n=1 Tax=Nocardioides albidus TaxID=1517589 RepID=A0A5C4VM80_9ACTN|nr:hypothetical protein [Nocardioides albidus]TNM36379.1 hypothetical protein FHP29_19730 [Nocardioides albidus]
MKNLHVRRALAGLSLGALAAAGLATVPAPANATVDDAAVGTQYTIDGSLCVGEDKGAIDPDAVPWKDDGTPYSASTSDSSTFTGAEGDTVDAATSMSATVTSSPLGSGSATITGSASATASALASGTETACNVTAHAAASASGFFTLTQPTWVTVTANGQGQRQGRAYGTSVVGIGIADGFASNPLFFYFGADGLTVSTGDRGSATATTLLPPGEYGVGFSAFAIASTHQIFDEGEDALVQEGSATYTGAFKIEMKPAGSASPVTGKGASKVQFGARDCASGNVPVSLSKKTVKKAERVVVRVDGKKSSVLKGKKLMGKKPKARTIVVPTNPTAVSKVKVKITLKNGRRVQATRSYLPCR